MKAKKTKRATKTELAKNAEAVATTTAMFSAWFATKFKGRRILKTAYHFLNWATKGNEAARENAVRSFARYCELRNVRSSWRNAAEWYVTGAVTEA